MDGDKTLSVREGTQSGDRLRMRGYGVPTLNGRGRGDQYVHIKCARQPRRQAATLGLHIQCTVPPRLPSAMTRRQPERTDTCMFWLYLVTCMVPGKHELVYQYSSVSVG